MRPHVSLNVSDVPKSIEFYKKVFGIEPQKQTSTYAKFDLQTPALNLSMQSGMKEISRVSHFGIEVDSADEVMKWQKKLTEAGLVQPGKLNSFAVTVMREIGIDISSQYSKSVADLPADFINGLDYVITLCAEEVCPVLLTKKAKKLHWPLKDPATKDSISDDEVLNGFREARDYIKARLQLFKKEIQ